MKINEKELIEQIKNIDADQFIKNISFLYISVLLKALASYNNRQVNAIISTIKPEEIRFLYKKLPKEEREALSGGGLPKLSYYTEKDVINFIRTVRLDDEGNITLRKI